MSLRSASAVTITDGMARRIASEWHAPNSAISTLSHTGRVDPSVIAAVHAELDVAVRESHDLDSRSGLSMDDVRELRALLAYCERIGQRDAVPGWSNLWDERRVSSDPKRSDWTEPSRAEEMADEMGGE